MHLQFGTPVLIEDKRVFVPLVSSNANPHVTLSENEAMTKVVLKIAVGEQSIYECSAYQSPDGTVFVPMYGGANLLVIHPNAISR